MFTSHFSSLLSLFLTFFCWCCNVENCNAFPIVWSPSVRVQKLMISGVGPALEQAAPSVRVLGVCGGIGSGKSTASKLLVSDLNCLAHLDADSVAHAVYQPGSQAITDLVEEFGPGILQPNGQEIDRKKLGAIVFADRSEMAKLERRVWPHVKDCLAEHIQSIQSEWKQNPTDKSPIIVVEAAVLLDANWDDILDGIWVVRTPRTTALQRLMETRGLSEEEANKRIDAQESRRGIGNLEEELQNKVVSKVIENAGSLEDLKQSLQQALDDPKAWKSQA
eukprot:Nitzschia sp. Nitz4//scaffold2_size372955//365995//366903//NITZ4_000484-RA/size372955-processed-gene-0.462-mRNA-1//1//CDS//3329546961//4733//frame0